MKIKKEKIQELINELDPVIEDLKQAEKNAGALLDEVNSTYEQSARNLIHYRAFRNHDLRPIQKKLRNLGVSRFNNATGHVLASISNIKLLLHSLIREEINLKTPQLSIKKGRKLLNDHTKQLLGYRAKKRRVRIMVTQPREAAYDYDLVHGMVKAGMNAARINCAHDDPEVWKKIIENVRKASDALNRKVVIAMDLAGPKNRTGTILPGPKVRKFMPKRDDSGNVLEPALIVLVPTLSQEAKSNEIPVGEGALEELKEGDELSFTDNRGKHRKLKVTHVREGAALLDCYDTSYIATGTVFHFNGSMKITVQELPPVELFIRLRVNDLLKVQKEESYGTPAKYNAEGELVQQACISCQMKEVFGKVKNDEKVLFDDGKIETEVIESKPDYFVVRVTKAKKAGTKLKMEKGINFPTTQLSLSGLTKKDKKDLKFIAEYADVVNFSFVNNTADVDCLLEELALLGVRNKLNVILKIETREAFNNLYDILFAAMKTKFAGVMIARGDLAVETGWDKIGWVQREILYACNAAHIPVVWATQVLENLAKKGMPSRSEITDAVTSLKAECVMLNKGNYILDAIRLLANILSDMEEYHEKNENMLPKLKQL